MHILNNLQPSIAMSLSGIRPATPLFQPGQLLQMMVIKPSSGGTATLDLAGTRFLADTDLPVRRGETLNVKVEKQGEQIQLRVLSRQMQTTDILAQGMRAALPKQAPMPPMMANLTALSSNPQMMSHALPGNLEQAIRDVLKGLPPKEQLMTSKGLVRAIKDSGLLLENKLLKAGVSQQSQQAITSSLKTATDTKVNLLRMLQILTTLTQSLQKTSTAEKPSTANSADKSSNKTLQTPTQPQTVIKSPQSNKDLLQANLKLSPAGLPPSRSSQPQTQAAVKADILSDMSLIQLADKLHKQTESSLSRLQLHQMNSLPTEESPRPTMLVEIPVRNNEQVDVWSLRFEEESPANKHTGQTARWSVNLAFELEKLGPVHVHVALSQGSILANFWAEQADTTALIESNFKNLRDGLVKSGIEVSDLNCFCGKPPDTKRPVKNNSSINLKV